jgi:hypothetical protein
MTCANRESLLALLPPLLQQLHQGLDSISYCPFETAQIFKSLELLHLARLRTSPKHNSISSTTLTEPQAPVAEALARRQEALVDNSVEQRAEEQTEEQGEPHGQGLAPLVPVGTSLAVLDEVCVLAATAPINKGQEPELQAGDQHLALVGNLTQGCWFEMQAQDGQKFRCRLAAIIRATGKYIFVNRSGMKVAEETRMTLAMALKSGRLQVLDDGLLFDRALESVIINLRMSAKRPGSATPLASANAHS